MRAEPGLWFDLSFYVSSESKRLRFVARVEPGDDHLGPA